MTDKSLIWNVYRHNINTRKIEVYNIFDHYSFFEECKKIAKKYKNDKATFVDEIRHSLMYYYWSKCEWEITIGGFPREDKGIIKEDVFDQVMLNWDSFIEYLWTNKKELK